MQDYKFQTELTRPHKSKFAFRLGLFALPLLILSGTALYADFGDEPITKIPEPFETSQQSSLTLPLELPKPQQPLGISEGAAKKTTTRSINPKPVSIESAALEVQIPATKWLSHKIKTGDTLAKIFSSNGLSANLLHRIVTSSKKASQLARIKPGQELKIELSEQGDFVSLIHQQDKINSLHIWQRDDSFDAENITQAIEYRTAFASGTIDSSLYSSAKEAGLTDTLIMSLANIFAWDIDFALEIRSGDRFTVIYQEKFLNGEKFGNGAILAAEFVNQGKVFNAVRYIDENDNSDYFTPDGKSVRKAFLRSPVDFRRISSRFQRERYHPVLGKRRPHRGVDYAAKTGTPIKAAGDGKIIFRGKKGGYGKTVIVQHGGGITTLYAHLNSYALKRKRGSRVKQGQVIGFVGKTGMATGPHLHYEFRVNGAHRNPLTVKLPAASPIAKKYREDFEQQTQPLVAQLAVLSRTLVADAQ